MEIKINKSGYYLFNPKGEIILFSDLNKKSDIKLYNYLENKLGKWSLKNADKWSKYEIFLIILKPYYENSYHY